MNARENGGDMAFPIVPNTEGRWAGGLTKREYAAIHILAGMHAGISPLQAKSGLVTMAMREADKLFEELTDFGPKP